MTRARETRHQISQRKAFEGRKQLLQGNLDGALRLLDEALELDPVSIDALTDRAEVYRRTGNLDAAKLDSEKARALQSTQRRNELEKWRARQVIETDGEGTITAASLPRLIPAAVLVSFGALNLAGNVVLEASAPYYVFPVQLIIAGATLFYRVFLVAGMAAVGLVGAVSTLLLGSPGEFSFILVFWLVLLAGGLTMTVRELRSDKY